VIIVLRALGLGDLLTVVPALRGLRRRFPAHEIALAAPAVLAPLVRRIGAVDRLLPTPSAVSAPPRHLPAVPVRPDLAVNLHGVGPHSTRLLRALKPRWLWAYGEPGAPAWSSAEHEVDRWCRLLAGYGCPTERGDLYLVDPGGRRDGPVLIHPGAADPGRRWPIERFGAVARGLTERGVRVRLTAGPGEHPLAGAVAAAAKLPTSAIAPPMDLATLADLVATSPLVICGDTGLAHLATACRTPSVVLFGAQSPARWGPPGGPRHRVLWGGASGAGPADSALLRIGPDAVLAAADELLATVAAP
jgi:ADP-heptose:LPS heptosyltransferase